MINVSQRLKTAHGISIAKIIFVDSFVSKTMGPPSISAAQELNFMEL
jgi:hypothetical protein